MDYSELPVHIGLIEQRRAKRLFQAQHKKPSTELLERPWISIPEGAENHSDLFSVKIMTWNLLAQCLVRRELFPTSDCLKAHQRTHLIHEEIERLDPEILCLQEVDRMEKLGPMLEKAGYSYRYATGPNKNHGCLIGYKSSLFSLSEEKVVYYDDEEIRSDGPESQRIGKSFTTRNIGLIVGLRKIDDAVAGIVVATTHLFWHPRYTYERARQAGILLREAANFKNANAETTRQNWPSIIAGDFNFTPLDPVYSLLTTASLSPEHESILHPSYVVHTSVDPNILPSTTRPAGDADEGGGSGEAQDPDRVIMNARAAEPKDGLLTSSELSFFYAGLQRVVSSYDLGLSRYFALNKESDVPIFGPIGSLEPLQPGYHEPAFTSYTHYWKSVLDYIFVLTLDKPSAQVTGLLAPLPAKVLDPGLPQKKICASDHLPLVAQIKFA